MSRRALGLDRFVALVAGLVGLVAGVVAILWVTGVVGQLFSGAPDSVDLHRGYDSVLGTGWWPWVAGGGGLVLALLGLWWLVSHFSATSVRTIGLSGGGPSGTLRADTGAVTRAAGRVFEATPGVRSGSASLRTDRGQLVLDLDGVVTPEVDLRLVAAAAVRTAGEVADVTGLGRLAARGRLTVSRTRRT